MTTDASLEQRLGSLYAVSVPTDLDRQILRAMTADGSRRSGRTRRRSLAALAIAALLAAVAAVPAVMWFEGWHAPFDHLWQISTPVDQTVTADGYRVTVHRAYADRLGVRLAISADDLEGRWSEFIVEDADVTDRDGRIYEAWNWSGSRTPVDDSTATWSRFLMPDEATRGDLKLRLTVTSLMVRLPEPISTTLDAEQIWRSVSGSWSFEIQVPVTSGQTMSPAVEPASGSGVTIEVEELGLVPSGTVVRLAVAGLPEGPAGSHSSWFPVGTVEHDGEPLSDDSLEPGIVGSDGVVTLELLPVAEDLAGHWKITVLGFHSFDATTKQFGYSEGPWVLEFNVAETP